MAPRPVLAAALSALLVAAWPAGCMAKEDKNSKFLSRMQNVPGASHSFKFEKGSDHEQAKPHRRALQTVKGAFDKAGSADHLAFLHSAQKNGVDANDLFASALDNGMFKALFGNTALQTKLVQELPMLKALPGFKDMTPEGFIEGTKALLQLNKGMADTVMDPSYSLKLLAEMRKSDDPATQDLFRLAGENDLTAVEMLQAKLSEKMFPGVDFAALKEAHETLTLSKLAATPELAYFIDQDPTVSSIFRSGN